MSRAALALPPTIGEIAPFQDAYLTQASIKKMLAGKIARDNSRFWTFNDCPTTIALPDNRFAKSIDSFRDHAPIESAQDDSRFHSLLREFDGIGIPRPSSYGDAFHEKFYTPRVRWSINSAFTECLTGGWQEARTGLYKGEYRKYDITSAYLWSGAQGLPDTTTFHKSKRIDLCRGDTHGLFRVTLNLDHVPPGTPAPYSKADEVIATDEEINRYNLPVSSVLAGVIWRDTDKRSTTIAPIIQGVSFWKSVARAYWGRWAQTAPIICHCRGKTWKLGNPALNTVWAHVIVSRVRMRLWEASRNAVHMYVDSVITKDTLPTGPNVGDWRLEHVYKAGVFIRGPGQYTDIHADRMERMAGVPLDSPKRILTFPYPYSEN